MSDYSYSNYSEEHIFDEHLSSNERILWAGKPMVSIMFSQEDIFLIPLSLVAGIPTFLWGIMIINFLPDEISPMLRYFTLIFTILAMLVGAYLILGRFIYKVWKKKTTFYAVTNKRILWISGLFSPHFMGLNIDDIADTYKKVSPDGIGTLKFSKTGTIYTDVFSGFYTNTGLDILSRAGQRYIFLDIEDGDKVYSIIAELMGSGAKNEDA